jgi:hypothetical protein
VARLAGFLHMLGKKSAAFLECGLNFRLRKRDIAAERVAEG